MPKLASWRCVSSFSDGPVGPSLMNQKKKSSYNVHEKANGFILVSLFLILCCLQEKPLAKLSLIVYFDVV